MVCSECTSGMEIILGTPDGTRSLQGVVTHVEARFGPFGGSVNLTQDRCTVCAECTSGMEIIFGTPVVLQGVVSHVEARFGAFGGSVTLGAR